ncbi:hypothetical protein KSF78_0004576 [Schistosoma japonicum]|nr:hypothetical protein KSF78_0004576 [Schistosoma japonicum]
MFYKKFLFLFMSSLLTCWGIDTPEYKSIAHGDLEKAYPKSWKAAKLFWEAAEEYFDQLNTTQHTNEKEYFDQLNTTQHTNETDGDLEKTLQNALEKMGKYLNASTDGDLEKTLQNALEKMGKYLNASTEGDLEKTLQNAEKNMEIYLNALNKMKKFELKAIKANMKYKNNSGGIFLV